MNEAVINTDYGYWEGGHDKSHLFDTLLSNNILEQLNAHKIKSVVDLGCGDGSYTKAFKKAGLRCDGFDGNPNTPELSGGVCKVLNLAEKVKFKRRYQAVLCLEVGEHVPAEYQEILFDNLCANASKVIVLSWAVPGQGGGGHVNEQNNQWVIDHMSDRGWAHNQLITATLRTRTNYPWFCNTVMWFTKG